MILAWLILILFVGGLAAWLADFVDPKLPRVVALIFLAVDGLLLLNVLGATPFTPADASGEWLAYLKADWMPRFEIYVQLGMDGLSWLMAILTVFLGIMATQASRMARLIDDLMSLSRIEQKAHLRPSGKVDLTKTIGHVVDALQPIASENGVAIAFSIPENADAFTVTGEPDELMQVFQNLIENAIKYGASGEKVEVSLSRVPDKPGQPDRIEASVRDFGPGIEPEHLPRLTERFYRADVTTSRERGGTGLGLAIVKHILNRHRASLAIDSKVGHGAAFRVRFDAARSD